MAVAGTLDDMANLRNAYTVSGCRWPERQFGANGAVRPHIRGRAASRKSAPSSNRVAGTPSANTSTRCQAHKDRRPGLDDLVRDARRRKVDAVIVWRLDRRGRSLRHLVLLMEELQQLGIALRNEVFPDTAQGPQV